MLNWPTHVAASVIQLRELSPHSSDIVEKAKQIELYIDLFDKNDDQAVSARKQNYAALAKFHPTLGADLYELG